MFSDLAAFRIGQTIKPEAILVTIDLDEQSSLQCLQLHQVEATLEDRLLNSLAGCLAHLRHTPKPPAAGRCLGIDVVAHDD